VSLRTYRVIVRGFFDGLDDGRRARLRAEAAAHDLFDSAFTEEGSLTYDEKLSAFSARVLVRVEPGADEVAEAQTAAELKALEHLDALGVGHRQLRSTATCMDDVKIRRR
jgi:hypothetical protein